MFRAGQISSKAFKRLAAQHGGVAPSKGAKTEGRMADFDAKERDEGAGRQRGVLGSRHINEQRYVRAGKRAHAGGLPSKGGQVQGKQPRVFVDEDEIDQDELQRPAFPAGARASGPRGEASVPRKPLRFQKGTIPGQGGPYGGGGRNTQ
jgi:hypothetical protein